MASETGNGEPLRGAAAHRGMQEENVSRSGYSDDLEQRDLAMWRGQVASAIRGKRGQAFLRELLASLDAMPEKRLISDALREDGEVCALGCIGARRGIELEKLDPEDYETLAGTFGIAHQLVQEIEWINDEWGYRETPEQRWKTVHDWAASKVKS